MLSLFFKSMIAMLLPAIILFVLIAGGASGGGTTFDYIAAFVMILLTLTFLYYAFSEGNP